MSSVITPNKSLTYTLPSSSPHITHSATTPPGPNELLVKVHAAAINPVDIQLWRSPLVGWIAGKKEKGIGRDYAGEIIAVGERLQKKWHEGDRVFGFFMRPTGHGTFTQYLTVSQSDPISKIPTGWSYTHAAAVPLVALTAFSCLDWLPSEDEKDGKRRVIVSGASGGVGTWCVQLAKRLYNCHVTGVCSGSNAEFVRGLGADEVVDYKKTDVAKTLLESRPHGRKYDMFIDCVGGVEMFRHWHELLHKNASYVTIVGDKTSRISIGGTITYLTHPASLVRYISGYFFGPRYGNIMLKQQSELLERVSQLGDDGAIEVVVQEVVHGIMEERSDAWLTIRDYMEEGRVRGKIVVDIMH